MAGRILRKEELAIDRCINGLKFLSIELSTKPHVEDPWRRGGGGGRRGAR